MAKTFACLLKYYPRLLAALLTLLGPEQKHFILIIKNLSVGKSLSQTIVFLYSDKQYLRQSCFEKDGGGGVVGVLYL